MMQMQGEEEEEDFGNEDTAYSRRSRTRRGGRQSRGRRLDFSDQENK